jgi:hypothetical protein
VRGTFAVQLSHVAATMNALCDARIAAAAPASSVNPAVACSIASS